MKHKRMWIYNIGNISVTTRPHRPMTFNQEIIYFVFLAFILLIEELS
jgi:hypothetical protein